MTLTEAEKEALKITEQTFYPGVIEGTLQILAAAVRRLQAENEKMARVVEAAGVWRDGNANHVDQLIKAVNQYRK